MVTLSIEQGSGQDEGGCGNQPKTSINRTRRERKRKGQRTRKEEKSKRDTESVLLKNGIHL